MGAGEASPAGAKPWMSDAELFAVFSAEPGFLHLHLGPGRGGRRPLTPLFTRHAGRAAVQLACPELELTCPSAGAWRTARVVAGLNLVAAIR